MSLSRCEIARQTRCKAIVLEVVLSILIVLHVPLALTIFQGNVFALLDVAVIALLLVGLLGAWRRSRKMLTVHFVVQSVLTALFTAVLFVAMVAMVVALAAVAFSEPADNGSGPYGSPYGTPAGNTTAIVRISQMQHILARGLPMNLGGHLVARSPAVQLVAAAKYRGDDDSNSGDDDGHGNSTAPGDAYTSYDANGVPMVDARVVAQVALAMFLVGTLFAVTFALQISNLVLTWRLRKAIKRIEATAAATAGADSTELPMIAAAAPMGAYLPVSTAAAAPAAAAAPQQVFYAIAPNAMPPPQYAAGFQPAFYLPAGAQPIASAPGAV